MPVAWVRGVLFFCLCTKSGRLQKVISTEMGAHIIGASLGRDFLFIDPGMAPRTNPELFNMDDSSR